MKAINHEQEQSSGNHRQSIPEGRKIGQGALAAAGRQGLAEIGQALKAFPDSIQVTEPGQLGTATPATVYGQQGMHQEEARQEALAHHGSVYGDATEQRTYSDHELNSLIQDVRQEPVQQPEPTPVGPSEFAQLQGQYPDMPNGNNMVIDMGNVAHSDPISPSHTPHDGIAAAKAASQARMNAPRQEQQRGMER